MPRIYDNVEEKLLDGLRSVIDGGYRADFCVGYLNLKGWGKLADLIDNFQGKERELCRVLIGMQRPPEEELRIIKSLYEKEGIVDGPTKARLKKEMIRNFKKQIEFGIPTKEAERSLKQLARQIRTGKVRIKLFLRYPLHAKLYLIHRNDSAAPLVGFLGSSNLTLSGLSSQGELNIDVLDQDAAGKLLRWFNERWEDRLSIDISEELAELIEESWAREELVSPYLVYLKMAYHLSEDARIGEKQFKLPRELRGVLLDFQEAAVKLAARKLYKYGGVLIGDVVGLGKTLMATAIAKIFQEDEGNDTLIICPPKLKDLWEWHIDQYRLTAKVISMGKVINELPEMKRYRIVIIDESHNLRNRETKTYRAIKNYIDENEPKVILLTATPYNKQYLDLSNQLRLFVEEKQDLGIRPEVFFLNWKKKGKTEMDFRAQYQTSPRSLKAFELSEHPEDWRELMRLFLVRRTRDFIKKNYAKYDEEKKRYYVHINDKRYYFPERIPKSVKFEVNPSSPDDQYAKLFTDEIVEKIESLMLPRYGLSNYLDPGAIVSANPEEKEIIGNLNRAGRKLIGFSRTSLFKRLESSGYSFLLSVKRHILRNLISVYALENDLPIPIGSQDPGKIDPAFVDAEEDEGIIETTTESIESMMTRAEELYKQYREKLTGFDWLPSRFFKKELKNALLYDAKILHSILETSGDWNPSKDNKLLALYKLISERHPSSKLLIFTQFADTAKYLFQHLKEKGIEDMEVIYSSTKNPVDIARRFSPNSNGRLRNGEREIRVLIATDVMAEGQNLQDCNIVVNYDLPWAIIRLIQRAGRVDRIGQKHDEIIVYSFLPADGVDKIIRLRKRLLNRLRENKEVIGTDERFFEEEQAENKLADLYTEKAGILDDDSQDQDIDLSSVALQVWNSAPEEYRKKAEKLPPVIYTTKSHHPTVDDPEGVLVYLRFQLKQGKHDVILRVDKEGNVISSSAFQIFMKAACSPDTQPLPPLENHHELTAIAIKDVLNQINEGAGTLGSRRTIRRRLFDRLKAFREELASSPNPPTELLEKTNLLIDLLFKNPLKESARDKISRQMKLGIPDKELVELVYNLYEDEKLFEKIEETTLTEPQILCSMGLKEV